MTKAEKMWTYAIISASNTDYISVTNEKRSLIDKPNSRKVKVNLEISK